MLTAEQTAQEILDDWTRAFTLVHAARLELIRQRAEKRRVANAVRKLPVPELR